MTDAFLHGRFAETLGWTLLHSLWQLALVAAASAVILAAMRRASAGARYALCCAALLVMTALPVATFVHLLPPPPPGPVPATPLNAPAMGDWRPSITVAHSPPMKVEPQTLNNPLPVVPPTLAARLRSVIPPLLPYAVIIYFTGLVLSTLRLGAGHLHLRRLRRHALPVNERLSAMAAGFAARLNLQRPLRILESSCVDVPSLLGVLRPVILVPVSILTELPPEHIEALLAHELAHLCRYDHLANLIQSLIETLLFYHPAVWWLSQRLRQERELACDDLALSLVGNRLTYAEALTHMESLRAAPALVLAASAPPLLARIRRILQLPATSARMRTSTLLVMLLPAAVVLSGLIYIAACSRSQAPTVAVANDNAPVRRSLRDAIHRAVERLVAEDPIRALTTGPATDNARAYIAQVDARVSAATRERQIIHRVAEVEEAYRDLWLARQNVEILGALVEKSKEAQARVIARSAVDADEIARAQVDDSVLAHQAELARAKSVLSSSSDRFAKLVGDDFQIDLTEAPKDGPIRETQSQLVESALNHRPEMQEVRLALAKVDARGSGGDSERRRLERAQLATAAFNTAQNIATDVMIQLRGARSNYEQIGLLSATLEARQRQLAGLVDKEAITNLTAEFLQLKLDTQARVAHARQNLIQAKMNYHLAIVRLELAKGTLLEYEGISLPSVAKPAAEASQPSVVIDAGPGGRLKARMLEVGVDLLTTAPAATVPADQVLIKALIASVDGPELVLTAAGATQPATLPAASQPGLSVEFVARAFSDTLRKLTAENRMEVLSRPNMLLIDRQEGVIRVGGTAEYISGYQRKDPADPKSDLIPTTEKVETGIKLGVRPFIGVDGFVRLAITCSDTNLLRMETIPAKESTPDHPLTIQKPILDVHSVETNVMVRNGETIIMGIPPTTPAATPSDTPPANAATQPAKSLYLFITPNIGVPATTPASQSAAGPNEAPGAAPLSLEDAIRRAQAQTQPALRSTATGPASRTGALDLPPTVDVFNAAQIRTQNRITSLNDERAQRHTELSALTAKLIQLQPDSPEYASLKAEVLRGALQLHDLDQHLTALKTQAAAATQPAAQAANVADDAPRPADNAAETMRARRIELLRVDAELQRAIAALESAAQSGISATTGPAAAPSASMPSAQEQARQRFLQQVEAAERLIPDAEGTAAAATATRPDTAPAGPIQSGDSIQVSVYELVTPRLTWSRQVTVDADGNINLQNVGKVHVPGLITAQAAEEIGKQAVAKLILLPKGDTGPGPQVTVRRIPQPTTTPASPVDTTQQTDAILRDRAMTIYHESLRRSDALARTTPPQLPVALKLAQDALRVIQDNQRLFTDLEADALRAQAARQIERITLRQRETNTATQPDGGTIQIAIESSYILVSDTFLDDFRIGWNIDLPVHAIAATGPASTGPTTTPAKRDFHATIIDNWTLSLLLTATQADKRAITVTAPRVTIANGQNALIRLPPPIRPAPSTPYGSGPGPTTQPANREPDLSPSAMDSIAIPLTATISADHRFVILDLTPPPASGKNLVSVPDSGTLLIDGGNFPPDDPASRRHLLILIKPKIIIRRENATAPATGPTTSPTTLFDGIPR